MKNNNAAKYFTSILKYLFVATIIVISTVPAIWVLMSSFKTNMEIFDSAFKLPGSFNFNNYLAVFRGAPMGRFYINSVIVSIFGTLINLFALGAAAYVFAFFDFKLKNVLMVLFSLTLLVPVTALMLPLYLTITRIGLYNQLLGVILVYAGIGIPVTLYLLRSYFQSIPKTIAESAYIDGAGFLRTYLRIILPIAKPGFATAGIIQFLLCWNEFVLVLLLTSGYQKRTLPVAISYFTAMFSANYGAVFAATTITIVPTIIVFIILQERVISSLAEGAVSD